MQAGKDMQINRHKECTGRKDSGLGRENTGSTEMRERERAGICKEQSRRGKKF